MPQLSLLLFYLLYIIMERTPNFVPLLLSLWYVFSPDDSFIAQRWEFQIYVGLSCVALLTSGGNVLAHKSTKFANYDLRRWWWIMTGTIAFSSLIVGALRVYCLRRKWEREVVWSHYMQE